MLTRRSRRIAHKSLSPRAASLALAGLLLGSLGCKKLDELTGEAKAEASAAAAPASAGVPPTSESAAGDKSGTVPMPLAVGQWATFKTTRDGKPGGDVTYRVTGKEDSAFWIQIDMEQPGGKATQVSILMDFKDGRSSKDFDVKRAKVQLPTGQTHTISGPMLDMAMKGFSGQLAALAIDSLEGLPQEDVTVPAGEFKGCYYRDFDVKVMNIHSKGRVWNHTKVPINAMIKNESTTNGSKVVFELKEFGTKAEP